MTKRYCNRCHTTLHSKHFSNETNKICSLCIAKSSRNIKEIERILVLRQGTQIRNTLDSFEDELDGKIDCITFEEFKNSIIKRMDVLEKSVHANKNIIVEQNDNIMELQTMLQSYEELKRVGHVFNHEIPKDHVPVKVFLRRLYDKDPQKYPFDDDFFSFSIKKDLNVDELNKRLDRKHYFVYICTAIAQIYFGRNQCAAPRVRNKKAIGELVKGFSGTYCMYPSNYLQEVEKIVQKYPFDNFAENKREKQKEKDTTFSVGKDGRFRCKICKGKTLKACSLNEHLKSKKHISQFQQSLVEAQ